MGVHQTIGKNGIKRFANNGNMNYWLCNQCGGFCGYTWAIPKVIRHAFCSHCDIETKQTATSDKQEVREIKKSYEGDRTGWERE